MDYKNGKIYKLVSNSLPDIYIGSTTQPLPKRLHLHKNSFKFFKDGKKVYKSTAFKLFEQGDVEIVLIELCPCNSKMELEAKERYFIETLECVNKVIPTRTQQEYRNSSEGKEKIKTTRKIYNDSNKDKIKLYDKTYKAIKITCECGASIKKQHLARHLKTQKHLAFVPI